MVSGMNTFRIDIKLSAGGRTYREVTHWASAEPSELDQVVQQIVGDISDGCDVSDREVSFDYSPCRPDKVPEGAFIHQASTNTLSI